MRESTLVNKKVFLSSGRPTCFRMEPDFWDALDEIVREEKVELGELIHRAQARAGNVGTRTSAVRVMVLRYFKEPVPEGRTLIVAPIATKAKPRPKRWPI